MSSFGSILLEIGEILIPLAETEANIYVKSASGQTQLSIQEPIVNDIFQLLAAKFNMTVAPNTTAATTAATSTAAAPVSAPVVAPAATPVESTPATPAATAPVTQTAHVVSAPVAAPVALSPAPVATHPHLTGVQVAKEIFSLGLDRPKPSMSVPAAK